MEWGQNPCTNPPPGTPTSGVIQISNEPSLVQLANTRDGIGASWTSDKLNGEHRLHLETVVWMEGSFVSVVDLYDSHGAQIPGFSTGFETPAWFWTVEAEYLVRHSGWPNTDPATAAEFTLVSLRAEPLGQPPLFPLPAVTLASTLAPMLGTSPDPSVMQDCEWWDLGARAVSVVVEASIRDYFETSERTLPAHLGTFVFEANPALAGSDPGTRELYAIDAVNLHQSVDSSCSAEVGDQLGVSVVIGADVEGLTPPSGVPFAENDPLFIEAGLVRIPLDDTRAGDVASALGLGSFGGSSTSLEPSIQLDGEPAALIPQSRETPVNSGDIQGLLIDVIQNVSENRRGLTPTARCVDLAEDRREACQSVAAAVHNEIGAWTSQQFADAHDGCAAQEASDVLACDGAAQFTELEWTDDLGLSDPTGGDPLDEVLCGSLQGLNVPAAPAMAVGAVGDPGCSSHELPRFVADEETGVVSLEFSECLLASVPVDGSFNLTEGRMFVNSIPPFPPSCPLMSTGAMAPDLAPTSTAAPAPFGSGSTLLDGIPAPIASMDFAFEATVDVGLTIGWSIPITQVGQPYFDAESDPDRCSAGTQPTDVLAGWDEFQPWLNEHIGLAFNEPPDIPVGTYDPFSGLGAPTCSETKGLLQTSVSLELEVSEDVQLDSATITLHGGFLYGSGFPLTFWGPPATPDVILAAGLPVPLTAAQLDAAEGGFGGQVAGLLGDVDILNQRIGFPSLSEQNLVELGLAQPNATESLSGVWPKVLAGFVGVESLTPDPFTFFDEALSAGALVALNDTWSQPPETIGGFLVGSDPLRPWEVLNEDQGAHPGVASSFAAAYRQVFDVIGVRELFWPTRLASLRHLMEPECGTLTFPDPETGSTGLCDGHYVLMIERDALWLIEPTGVTGDWRPGRDVGGP